MLRFKWIFVFTSIFLLLFSQITFVNTVAELSCPQSFVLNGQTLPLKNTAIDSGPQKNGSYKCTYYDPTKESTERMTGGSVVSFSLLWRTVDTPTHLQMKCDVESKKLQDSVAGAGKYVIKKTIHYSLEKQISVTTYIYKGDETPEIKKFTQDMMKWVYDVSASCKQNKSDEKTDPKPVSPSSQTVQPSPKTIQKPEWYSTFEKYCRENPKREMCSYWNGQEPNVTEQEFWKLHANYCKENPNFEKCPKQLDEPWMKQYVQLCKERGGAVEMCRGWLEGDQPKVSQSNYEIKFSQYCKDNPMHDICYQDNDVWKIDVIKYCNENNRNYNSNICQEFKRNNGDIIKEHYDEEFSKYCKENPDSKTCPQIGIEPWKRVLEEQCRYGQEGTICVRYHESYEQFTLKEFLEYCKSNPTDSICHEAYLEDWQVRLVEYCTMNSDDDMCRDWRPGETPNVQEGEFEVQFEKYCKGNLSDSYCTKMVDADWNRRIDRQCQDTPNAPLCQDILVKKQKPHEAEFINICAKQPNEKFCKQVFRSDWKMRYAQYCLENRDLSDPKDVCWRWSPGTVPSVTEYEFDKKFAQFCDGMMENSMCKRYIEIPDWFKQSTKFYVSGNTSHEEFINSIQFMINEKMINVPQTDSSSQPTNSKVKDMVKQNAEWWSNGLVSDRDFVKHLEFLIKQGILNVN